MIQKSFLICNIINHESKYRIEELQCTNNTHKLLWIIIFLVALIITVTVSYVLGSQKRDQNTAKPVQTTKTKNTESTSSNVTKSPNQNKNTSKATTTNQSSSIPNQFWGTWYAGNEKFAVISDNKFILSSAGMTITKSSLPLQLNVTPERNGTYMLYLNPNPNASAAEGGEETVYWIGNLTINGQKERVLAAYEKQGVFEIFTSHPTSSKQWIQYDLNDYENQIGNTNLDSLKGKSRNDMNQTDIPSKKDDSIDNDNHNDSNNDVGMNKSDNNQIDNDSDNRSNNSANNDNQDNSNQ